jgi:hypothetical protein
MACGIEGVIDCSAARRQNPHGFDLGPAIRVASQGKTDAIRATRDRVEGLLDTAGADAAQVQREAAICGRPIRADVVDAGSRHGPPVICVSPAARLEKLPGAGPVSKLPF